MTPGKLALAAAGVPAVPFGIPGATGEFRIQLLNQDSAAGVVTSVIHLPPGGRIPAHRHSAGSEMHYVLEGDLIEAGRELGPGAFLTHAAGQVHGPHESRGGAKVLTVQSWQSAHGDYDFEPVEEGAASEPPQAAPARMPEEAGTSGGERARGTGGMQKVDQTAQEQARQSQSDPTARGYS
ncbi:cupin domain-containing protein [Falsiroseomonas oryzae]|uniref:cupin domain-containing protein n=1 Tax=Falsiroseomonas oryzae TaxID=2766473 RepID=UPI0022EA58A0|nr:cupin domain-containing protein [Roseomonas sp. MO-31]